MTDQDPNAQFKNFLTVLRAPWSGSWSANLYSAMTVGFVAVIVHGFFVSWQSILTSLLLSGAMLLIGVLMGFLFGVPRTLQGDGTQKVNPQAAGDVRYLPNTNLEQISDWLTKVLVGVGLTQLTTIPDHIARFGTTFGPAVGGTAAPTFAITIGIFFSITGFMIGYLWTRIYLALELVRVDGGREVVVKAATP